MVVDAGPLVAYVDRSSGAHAASLALFEQYAGRLVVPALVLAEAAYLIARRVGGHAEAAFVADVAVGDFSVESPAPADWERILELVVRYRDMRLGTTDASVIAAAERLGITRIATLDRRHFAAVRPRHAEAFELPLLG